MSQKITLTALDKDYKEAEKNFVFNRSSNDGLAITRKAAHRMIDDYWNDIKAKKDSEGDAVLDNNAAIVFDKQALLMILMQTDCEKIRFYFCKNHEGKTSLVMIGADSRGGDLTAEENQVGSFMPITAANRVAFDNRNDTMESTIIKEVGGPKTFREFIEISDKINELDLSFEGGMGEYFKELFT